VNAEELTPPVSNADHAQGPSAAAVTLVQYGDYECPFTIGSHWQIALLRKNFPNDLRFVFRHFPLLKRHMFALRAAESVEAAAVQGKFWEMHDALLSQRFNLGWESLRDAARDLRLDLPKFESEVLDHVHRRKIQDHINGGIRGGVSSTPSYFLNGAFYDGPDNYDDFATLIRGMLEKRS
jgi:protein-disulfide isomerase